MKFSSDDYDKLIEILYRNPFIYYKDIAAQFDNYSQADISFLFKEIRKEYVDAEAIDTFLANNSTPQDTILFINGALKSLFKDSLDQSSHLGLLFEEIGESYESEERIAGNVTDPCYSVLYKYLAALMQNKKLPKLSATESAQVLALMFEVLNFSNEMFARRPDFTSDFCENIQTKLGQVLLKSVLNENEWTKANDDALVKAFDIPVVNLDELEKDSVAVNKKVQKQIAMSSMNPFKVSEDEINCFKGVFDELMAEDREKGRDIEKIFDTLGVVPDRNPVVAKANDGQTLIVHKKSLTPQIHTAGGTRKMSAEEMAVEHEISNMSSCHDIIDVNRYNESLRSEGTSTKRRKLTD